MKFKIHMSPLIHSALKSNRCDLLILALTSLLYCGIGLTWSNFAAAFPGGKQVNGDANSKDFVLRISQLSQNRQKVPHKLPKAIAAAVQGDAAKRSGVAITDLQITQVTPKTFGNPCEFKFGEICTKEYNPIQGWEVVVRVQEQSWTYHINKSGSQIVLDPKVRAAPKG